jgi:hypothetical protein
MAHHPERLEDPDLRRRARSMEHVRNLMEFSITKTHIFSEEIKK